MRMVRPSRRKTDLGRLAICGRMEFGRRIGQGGTARRVRTLSWKADPRTKQPGGELGGSTRLGSAAWDSDRRRSGPV